MKIKMLVAVGAIVLLLVGAAAGYLHAPALHAHAVGAVHGSGAGSPTVTLNAQPGTEEFRRSPHVREFYELAQQAFADGPDNVDLAAFEEKSFAIFRSLGASIGGSPAAMQHHLKDIPRELIGIVRADPHTLDSYDNFTTALLGPP
jgi:hypothetical protein